MTKMPNWIKIAETGDISPGAGKAFEVEGLSIAIFNVGGTLYAIGDSCPHQGSSLAMGSLEGCTITCRSHGMKVNVSGGQKPGTGMIVGSYPLESRSDGLYIDLPISS
jgi:3-phenylpropionate/trans-cinnamate dioxygenase ferredoxin component